MGEQVAARSNGDVAQLGEHLPCKQGVRSSNLLVSTMFFENCIEDNKLFMIWSLRVDSKG